VQVDSRGQDSNRTRINQHEYPLADLCRKYNVSPNAIYDWKEKFMEGGKLALSGGLKDPAKEKEAEIERLKKLIGELTIANDAMKKVLQGEGKK
jgi:transposase